MDQVTTTIVLRKKKLTVEQRSAAKALLLETFPNLMSGGQLIIHFGPGRNPFFVEAQTRVDHQFQNVVDNVA